MKKFTFALTAFLLLSAYYVSAQATFTSKATGLWNATGTWTKTGTGGANTFPGVNDNVVILGSHQVNINITAATCKSLTTRVTTAGTTTQAPKINFSVASASLTVTNDLTIESSTTLKNTTSILTTGTTTTGTLTIGGGLKVGTAIISTAELETKLIINSVKVMVIVTSDLLMYTSVKPNKNVNVSLVEHTSGSVEVNGSLSSYVEDQGFFTKYTTGGSATLTLKNGVPVKSTFGGQANAGQISLVFSSGTVVYSPSTNINSANGIEIYPTTYKNLTIDGDYTFKTIPTATIFYQLGFTIGGSGKLSLNKGSVDGPYTLADKSTIVRSGGGVTESPNVPEGKYNVEYSENTSKIVSGKELTQVLGKLKEMTINTSNGVEITTISDPEWLTFRNPGFLSGSGKINVTERFKVLGTGAINVGDRVVTLISTFGKTAYVDKVPATATITGVINVQRYLSNSSRKWRLVTAPVKGSDVTTNSVFYNWQNNGVTAPNTGIDIWGPNGNPAVNGLSFIRESAHSMRSWNNTLNRIRYITDTKTESLFSNTINKAFYVFAPHAYGFGTNGSGDGIGESSITTLSSSGTLLTGDIVHHGIKATGYYFLGNPYASAIDFKSMLQDATNVGISKKIWLIDPQASEFGGFISWDESNGYSIDGSGYAEGTDIQSGQAFFVRADDEGSSLTVKEDHKTTTSSMDPIARTSAQKKNLVSSERFRIVLLKEITDLNAKESEALMPKWLPTDGAVAGFYAAGDNTVTNKDVSKFGNPNEMIAFYTDNKSFSSEHRASIVEGDFLDIKLSQMAQGSNYKLELYTQDFGYNGQAYLQDSFLKTSTALPLDGSRFEYKFSVTAAPESTGVRFKIVFQNSTLNNPDFDSANILVYPNPVNGAEGVTITFNNEVQTDNFEYAIINVLGQNLQTSQLEKSGNVGKLKFKNKMASGIYFLQLRNLSNNTVSTKKLIIN
ncbi:hypothetical protein RCH18_000453 [Flavobacterium sp. PL11]|uniref:T9SS type A sorting domain-containing protein n=1 Tax=Flavobacterium sp. PL11 TaxID=3071717 RepID=UPI002E0CBBE0|nr:hypothetical protein [Flavobacterium sp. PL11]